MGVSKLGQQAVQVGGGAPLKHARLAAVAHLRLHGGVGGCSVGGEEPWGRRCPAWASLSAASPHGQQS